MTVKKASFEHENCRLFSFLSFFFWVHEQLTLTSLEGIKFIIMSTCPMSWGSMTCKSVSWGPCHPFSLLVLFTNTKPMHGHPYTCNINKIINLSATADFLSELWKQSICIVEVYVVALRHKSQKCSNEPAKEEWQEILTTTIFLTFNSTFCFEPWLATTIPCTHTDAPVAIEPASTYQLIPELETRHIESKICPGRKQMPT